MNTKKRIFVNDIKEGQQVDDLFMVREMSRSETRSGKPYLALTLLDRTGDIGGRLWENADKWIDECRPGAVILLSAQAQAYKGTLQLKINRVRAIQDDKLEIDMGLFVPSSASDISEMANEIVALAKSVQDPNLKKLLLSFFKSGDFFNNFQRAPAAKRMHHAYHGGLLEHTLSVARLAAVMPDFYPAVDHSLLLAGALLHDIGKVKEFSYDSYPFNYTDKGRLVGHLVLGAEMVQAEIDRIKDFPEELSTRIQHLILSHHGQFEYGSPCLPMMLEAFVLNFIDDLDAKANFFSRMEEGLKKPGYQWTDYQKILERFLFVRARGSNDPATANNNDDLDTESEDSKQQRLF